jgi:hypothetical protein
MKMEEMIHLDHSRMLLFFSDKIFTSFEDALLFLLQEGI